MNSLSKLGSCMCSALMHFLLTVMVQRIVKLGICGALTHFTFPVILIRIVCNVFCKVEICTDLWLFHRPCGLYESWSNTLSNLGMVDMPVPKMSSIDTEKLQQHLAGVSRPKSCEDTQMK